MPRKGSANGAVLSALLGTFTNYSWAFWFRPTGAPSTLVVTQPYACANATVTPATEFGFSWSYNNAAFRNAAFHEASGGSYVSIADPSPSSSAWVHYAATFDGSTLRFYKNGSLVSTVATSNPAANSVKMSALAGAQGATNFEPGTVADAALWSITLTANEVAMVYHSSPGMTRPDFLKVYWPLHGIDTTETDYSPNNKPGTVSGTTTVVNDGTRTGKYLQCRSVGS